MLNIRQAGQIGCLSSVSVTLLCVLFIKWQCRRGRDQQQEQHKPLVVVTNEGDSAESIRCASLKEEQRDKEEVDRANIKYPGATRDQPWMEGRHTQDGDERTGRLE